MIQGAIKRAWTTCPSKSSKTKSYKCTIVRVCQLTHIYDDDI
uniref:Uncharacterized protein n=1 Tax=Rhizophora mucronata TaxID=61149 RepID=A0A2P2MXY4_RHIMU